MRKTWTVITILFFSLIFTSGIAQGNAFDTFGYDSRATAMGGAYTAMGDELTATYYNPAALTEAGRIRAEFGYFITTPSLNFAGAGSSEELKVDATKGFNLGMAVPLGDFYGSWVWGFGFHNPQELAIRPRFHSPTEPYFLDYSNRTQELIVLPAIGFSPKFLPGLSAGLGITVVLDTEGKIIAPSEPVDDDQIALTRSDLTMVPTIATHAGLLYQPMENLRVGLAFRDKLVIDIDTVTIIPDFDTDVSTHAATLFSPRQISLGVAYDPIEKLTVAFDLTWIDWSEYKPPFAMVEAFLLGSEDPKKSTDINPDFKDTYNPKLGIEYHLYDFLDLRAGYSFEPSPVPDRTLKGTSNILDSHTQIFSGGFGLYLGELCDIPFLRILRIDGHLQFVSLTERKVEKNPGLMLESDEDARLENPGYPGFKIDGSIFNWGLSASLVFKTK
jgi:long-chain fatty acid transport protein